MAKLAILGHATRGKEVIGLLEMLGGKNDNHCCGGFLNSIYFINNYGYIESCDRMQHLDYLQLTLEEFLENFPFKVGEEVWMKTYSGNVYCNRITGIHIKQDGLIVYSLLNFADRTEDELFPTREELLKSL